MAAKKKAVKEKIPPAPTNELAHVDELIAKSAKGGGTASDARTALLAFADDVVGPRFVIAATSSNPKIRAAAVEGGTVTPRRRELFPLDVIAACLADDEPKVRLAALSALNRGWGPKNDAIYAPKKAEIEPAIEPLLSDADKTVASQAAVVWKRLGL